MTIKLSRDIEKQLIDSIKQYYKESMDREIGELKAALLLDFFLKEMAPCVYNQAIADAQAVMQEKVNDLDGTCYQVEFGYWKK